MPIGGLKGGHHHCSIIVCDNNRCIRAVVLEVHAAMRDQSCGGFALRLQFAAGLRFEPIQRGGSGVQAVGIQPALNGLFTQHRGFGQPHSIGRQHARQWMRQNRGHGQRIGHGARMLPPRPAKHGQGIRRDVVAALHRDALDRIGHVGIGYVDKALRHRVRRQIATGSLSDTRGQRIKPQHHGVPVKRLICTGSEDRREMLGLQAPQHHIGIGHRQRTAAPVAGRPGIGPRRIRAHPHARAVKVQDRATACGHRMNAHHRRAQPHASHLRVEDPLELACVMRHVGRGAAHVKADHAVITRGLADPGHPDDAARRAREHRVLALKRTSIGEPAIGLHELQAHTGQAGGHAIHITTQHRRQIRVHNGGIGARHKADQR